MESIQYKDGYKYQLAKDCRFHISIQPGKIIETRFVRFQNSGKLGGWLEIDAGYAWDGPSGPAIDTKNFMRGSLVHDALYQLIRNGHLDAKHRDAADRILQRMCIQDGMSRIRAWWVYKSLKWFGGPAADESHKRKLLTAP